MIKGLSDRVKVKGLQAESYREKLVQQESRDERKGSGRTGLQVLSSWICDFQLEVWL